MKRFITFNLLLILFAACSQNKNTTITSKDLKNCILTTDNKPTKQLKDLLTMINIHHNGTFEDIASKVHETWCYPPVDNGCDFTAYENKKSKLRPLFERLGMINTIEGMSKTKYKYAIVASGFVGVTLCRLDFLKKFWEKGVRFEKIIILTGQRDLVDGDGPLDGITLDKTVSYKTEHDLITAAYKQLHLPEAMKKVPVVFVNTPPQKTDLSKLNWPYPREQVKCWLETNPEPGDCLAVTNQPYVRILETILHNVLPETFKDIDAVGYAINQKYESAQVWLNALSWLLYEEQYRLKNLKSHSAPA